MSGGHADAAEVEILGYLHQPLLWIEDRPNDAAWPDIFTVHNANPDLAGEMVVREDLGNGMIATAYRDGLFAIEFGSGAGPGPIDWETRLAAQLNSLNAHVVCLHSAMATAQRPRVAKYVVSPRRRVQTQVTPEAIIWKCNDDLTRALLDVPGRKAPGMWVGDGVHVETRWIPHRHRVEPSVVRQSFQFLGALISSRHAGGLSRYAIVLRASEAVEEHDYDLALVLSWAVLEDSITKVLLRVADSVADQLSGTVQQRKFERLHVAAKVDVLRMFGVLSDSLYGQINSVRKSRNNWMHALQPVERDAATTALVTASMLLSLADEQDWAVNIHPAWLGI